MTSKPRLRELLAKDLARYTEADAGPLNFVRTLAGEPGLLASSLMRVQQRAMARQHVRSAKVARYLALTLTGAEFVPGCQVGSGLRLSHPHGVVIGGGAVLGDQCTLLQNVTLGERYVDGAGPHDYPTLRDNVTIGAGAVVLGNVVIGQGATIGPIRSSSRMCLQRRSQWVALRGCCRRSALRRRERFQLCCRLPYHAAAVASQNRRAERRRPSAPLRPSTRGARAGNFRRVDHNGGCGE